MGPWTGTALQPSVDTLWCDLVCSRAATGLFHGICAENVGVLGSPGVKRNTHGLINSVGRARILLPCADIKKKKKKSIAVNVCLWQGKDDLKC